ncbi:hypothetical protein EJ04DRAFT_556442 [Polyplosphaeria fusca]|uniref:Uncharacterized protein n=1 Tax=Polyplosphaeria fusca TaxID=682080 RepID=A0A9P4QP33_9PLEO|nr:hypothetical protein EJ04DRAFT_556442 [Polyplosphaeria fusca]
MAIASLALTLLLVILCWISHRDNGLGTDNGSDWILLCWRYLPTIVAVVYAQLVAMMFYDIKRTQPFARMAKSRGAAASDSVLYTPRMWCLTLVEGFSKMKNGGEINMLLVGSALLYAVSILVISPLSSSLLLSYSVVIADDIQLRAVTVDNLQLAQQASPETINRAMGSLFYNLSTGPWVSDRYSIAPFGPVAKTGSSYSESDPFGISGNWTANTAIFSVDYQCSPMRVRMSWSNNTFSAKSYKFTIESLSNTTVEPGLDSTMGTFSVNGTSMMRTSLLSGADGCEYRVDQSPTLKRSEFNTTSWTGGPDPLFDVGIGTLKVSNEPSAWVSIPKAGNRTYTIPPHVGPASPFLRFEHSEQCDNKDIIFLMTPIAADAGEEPPNNTEKAWTCLPSFYMAEMPVTFSTLDGISRAIFNESDYRRIRLKVSENILNTSMVRQAFHKSDWSSFADQTEVLASKAALPLVASFDYKMNKTLADPHLPDAAQLVYRRFFSELTYSKLLQAYNNGDANIKGQRSMVRKRVMVLQGVGISLAALLFLNSILLFFVAWRCRPRVRPLKMTANSAKLMGVSKLMASTKLDKTLWKNMVLASKSSMESKLTGRSYHVFNDGIWETTTDTNMGEDDCKQALAEGLVVILVCFLVAIAVLDAFARRQGLTRTAFLYEATLSFLTASPFSFAPASIIPTLFAIGIGLWWSAVQESMCFLQPYVMLAREHGTPLSVAGALYYNPAHWPSAFIKAFRHRHWQLFLVTGGMIFCQLLTISTSALFERDTYTVSRTDRVQRSLELRQVPLRTEADSGFPIPQLSVPIFGEPPTPEQVPDLTSQQLDNITQVNPDLYWTSPQSWLYSALNELTSNGSKPSWSSGGWTFMPVDLSGSINRRNASRWTLQTPAIRARAECSPISHGLVARNYSSWVETYDLTDSSVWQTPPASSGLTKAYGLTPDAFYASPWWQTDFCPDESHNYAGGRWSPFSDGVGPGFPRPFSAWPVNFTVTWLQGRAQGGFLPSGEIYPETFTTFSRCQPTSSTENKTLGLFTEMPRYQSMECRPVIESADSRVTVDREGNILAFEIESDPQPATAPWKDVLQMYSHDTNDGNVSLIEYYNSTSDSLSLSDEPSDSSVEHAPRNVTTSYGIYFLSMLLQTSEFNTIPGASAKDTVVPYYIRDLENHLDMDLMTYCMYTLANKSVNILLEEDEFGNLVNRVFQTLFQHFVTSNTSFTSPSWAYQPIGMQPEKLGHRLFYNRSDGYLQTAEPITYPNLGTNGTVEVIVEHEVEVLKMNAVATYLTLSILALLLLIIAFIGFSMSTYLQPLQRDVNCLADVMLLLVGSERFLQLIQERGIEDRNVLIRLGWFKTEEGDVRWGIELMEDNSPSAVQWLAGPEAI